LLLRSLAVKNLVLAQNVSLCGHRTKIKLIPFAEHSANGEF